MWGWRRLISSSPAASGSPLSRCCPPRPSGNTRRTGTGSTNGSRRRAERIILGATVTRIDQDAVIYRQQDEEKRIPAALVVTAMGAKSENALEGALKELAIPYRIVGDAQSPRRLLEAIHEGDRAGREI